MDRDVYVYAFWGWSFGAGLAAALLVFLSKNPFSALMFWIALVMALWLAVYDYWKIIR